MLKTQNLTVKTDKGRTLIENFSFVLNDDDKIALIGEEGNGKSTLLKVLAGQITDDYVEYTGQIIKEGSIGYLPQKLDDKWNDKTFSDYLTKVNNDSFDHYDDYSQLCNIMTTCNLPIEYLDSPLTLKNYSGGEKVKMQIAKLLYYDYDILLLDEPTNDLDLKSLIWLEGLISYLSKPIIFVSHDETLLQNCANGIIHIEQLKAKQQCKITINHLCYDDYIKERYHTITRTNQIAAKEKSELTKQLERYRQLYQKVDYQINTVSRGDPHQAKMLKRKMKAVKTIGKHIETQKGNITEKYEPEEAINIFFNPLSLNPNKIILDYSLDKLEIDGRILSTNINLLVKGKDKICLIGNNGCGKTTLIKKVLAQLVNRQDIKVGYIPQNYPDLIDYALSPIDFLMQNQPFEKRSTIQSYLGALRFTTEEMSHRIAALSEGQKCKILFIHLVINNYEVLVLDEPTRNLSPLSNPKIRELLINYQGCIIAVSHDRKFINEVANKVYELTEDGLKLVQ